LEEINRISAENKLSSLEKPKEIHISKEPFSVENNILTPTFKLKRNIARDVYKKEID
jgi:long-chain acyl-CoA synthetase